MVSSSALKEHILTWTVLTSKYKSDDKETPWTSSGSTPQLQLLQHNGFLKPAWHTALADLHEPGSLNSAMLNSEIGLSKLACATLSWSYQDNPVVQAHHL